GVVVHVREFLDLAAGQRAEHADEAAANAQSISDVAQDEVARLIAGVELAIEVLAGAGGREKLAGVLGRPDRRADRQELEQAADALQLRGDAGQTVGLFFKSFIFEAFDGGVTTVRYKLGDAFDFAACQRAEAAGHAANDAERIDAVADDDVARHPP